MIQRKQNLYLFIAVFAIAVFIIADFNLFESIGALNNRKMYCLISFQKTTIISPEITSHLNVGIVISLVISLFLCISSIFMYKNLKLQSRLVALNFLIITVTIFFIFQNLLKVINSFDEMLENNFAFGLMLPFLLYLLNFLALKGIRKDIDILASADRLR